MTGGMNPLRSVLTAWLNGLAELLLYFPILVLIDAFMPGMPLPFPLLLGAMSLLYALGFAFYVAVPSARHWQSFLVGIAAPGLAAWLLGGTEVGMIVQFAVFALAWVRGARNRLRGWDRSFNEGLQWLGLGVYFVTAFLYPRAAALAAYAPWITGLGIAALAFTLYHSNSTMLRKETLHSIGAKKPQVGADTKWRNRLMVLGLFGVALLISAVGALAEAARTGFAALFRAVAVLYAWLMSFIPLEQKSEPGSKAPSPLEGLPPPAEPSAFAKLMEQILYGAVLLLLAAVAIGLLYLAGKYAIRYIRRLMNWYGERLDADLGIGYVDEKQSLLDPRDWAKERADHWRQRLAALFRKEPGWNDLRDNRERVRHAYRRMLLGRIARGYEHDEGLTPRETGRKIERRSPLEQAEADSIRLYEEARYGGKEVSDEQANRLRGLFGK